MTSPELHPDDLLDKEAREGLSAPEQAKLDEHLRLCAVCRFERDARDDFRAEFEAEARRSKNPSIPQVPVEKSEAPAPSSAPTSRRRALGRVRWLPLLAAAILVAGGAAAEWAVHASNETAPVPGAVESANEPAPSSEPRDHRRTAAVPSPSPSPLASEPLAPTASEEPISPPPAPSHAAPERRVHLESAPPATHPREAQSAAHPPAVLSTSAVAAEIAPPPSATQEEVRPPPPPATAASLLSNANEARKRGAYDEALRDYDDLSQRFPGSPEATLALAISGRLLLDRGDATYALRRFDAYLASGSGALREEAMLGRALALQRLGRAGEEAAAWRALLDAFPRSVHAARARARLAGPLAARAGGDR